MVSGAILLDLIQDTGTLKVISACFMLLGVANPYVPTQILTFLYTVSGAWLFTSEEVFRSTSTATLISPALVFPVMFTEIMGSVVLKTYEVVMFIFMKRSYFSLISMLE